MKLERERGSAWRVTLHPLELAALISAARWVADGAEGELPPEAVDQLRRIVRTYDAELSRQGS